MSKLLLFCLLLVALTACGCADFKTYIKARGNDLADCFTARVGIAYGLGVRAQVTSYFGASVGASLDKNKVGYFGREPVKATGGWMGVPLFQVFSPFLAYAVADLARKGDCSREGPPVYEVLALTFGSLLVTDVRHYKDETLPMGCAALGIGIGDLLGTGRMRPPTPFLREKFFIEVGGTLGVVGFDVGFNPVEFVDFLLGWFGVDIARDDYYSVAEKVQKLADAFRDQDSRVRINAVRELRKLASPRVIPLLIEALKSEFDDVRAKAVYALGKIRDKSATMPLGEVLDDQKTQVRLLAVQALGKIGDRRAIEPLTKALDDEDPEVRRYAVMSLTKVGGRRVVELLIQALSHRDSSVRGTAAHELGVIGDKKAVEPLVEALEDEDSSTRRFAAEALGKLGDKRAVGPLIELLKHEEYIVQRDAVHLLKKITKQDFGEDYDKWKEWYEESRDK
jgi:HEAT repeat protein